jgi:hypothetical protein
MKDCSSDHHLDSSIQSIDIPLILDLDVLLRYRSLVGFPDSWFRIKARWVEYQL